MAKSKISPELETGVDERTSLLAGQDGSQRYTEQNPTDTRSLDFNGELAQAESQSGILGAGPESQETPMLREPQKLSPTTNGNSNSDPEAEEEEPKSPYLAGVSVTRFWLIFGGIMANFFVACIDTTLMVSSHPVITGYFKSANSASWLSTAFLLTSTAFQPLFGRLSDTIGRKVPYIFSMSVFLAATVWCALAPTMTSFIAARALCGLGAGGMLSLGSIITSDLVPIEIRGAYQSYLNIIYGAGSALGAALGGAIADSLGWRWEFGIQVPLISLCLIMACVTTPSRLGLRDGMQQKTLWEAMRVFDFKGSILLTTSITFLILGLNLGGNVYAWSHPFVITSLVIFGLCFPLFLWVESIVALPIMPLNLLWHNPRAGLIFGNCIGSTIANTITFNAPLFFQAVLLDSATSSGLRLIVPTLASSGVGAATGFLITYTRRLKWPLVLGTSLLMIGTTCLTAMQRGLPDWAYILFLIPTSMGAGFCFPGTFMAVLAVSEQQEQAVVTSTLILWRSLGNVMGVALSSLVVQNALVVYLNLNVVGPEKDAVIREVRKSVQAIGALDPVYREQVIESYASSLRAAFVLALVLAVTAFVISVTLRLPRLERKRK